MKQFILAAFSILLFSCTQEDYLDGTYVSNENSFVYGLKVNKPEKEVRLFLLEELSTEITFEEYSAQQDWVEYRIGTLKPNDDNGWSLLGVDSDVDISDKPESIDFTAKNDTIKVNCEDVYNTFIGTSLKLSRKFCNSDFIVFHKVK